MVPLDKIKNYYKILQSAFVCKNATNPTFLEDEFNSIIKNHLATSQKELYRGVSIKEILNSNFKLGEKIKLNRITSFSEDKKIAEDYAANEYGTHCLFLVKDLNGFNYTETMAHILRETIFEEYETNTNEADLVAVTDYLNDQLSMVLEEKEWMVESDREFTIKNIDYRSRYDMSKEYTIIELA